MIHTQFAASLCSICQYDMYRLEMTTVATLLDAPHPVMLVLDLAELNAQKLVA